MAAFWAVLLMLCGCADDAFEHLPVPPQWSQLVAGDRDATTGQMYFRRVFKAVNAQTQGDGLGPLFNASSCMTCHPSGGSAGTEHNVQLISFLPTNKAKSVDLSRLQTRSRIAVLLPSPKATGFMLPRNSTNIDYEQWRLDFLGLLGNTNSKTKNERIQRVKSLAFAKREPVHTLRTLYQHRMVLSERNTPALHGAGLIDRVSKQTLQDIQLNQSKRDDGITGRIADVGTKVGRFGWRGQTATLEDFVAGACRNELGLQIRMNAETPDPLKHSPNSYDDLPELAVFQMTRFLSLLPAPKQVVPTSASAKNFAAIGRGVMRTIHCDRCHQEDVGEAEGIFSDLLLHDMGQALSDPIPANPQVVSAGIKTVVAQGYFGPPEMTVEDLRMAKTNVRQEWRTPPLWGAADSAPYLHDGRAKTLYQAIVMHDGEAARSKQKFLKLNEVDQRALIAFLETLRAP